MRNDMINVDNLHLFQWNKWIKSEENRILGKRSTTVQYYRNLLFLIQTDQCWNNLVGEDKVLDGGGDVDEDEEEGDVLDPAPLDDLPEARPVGETLLWISDGGGHREVLTA